MNYKEYTKSTNQNCVDPTEWNGTNPCCEQCDEELDQSDFETICVERYENKLNN